jgi:hypothetical protein
MNWSRDCGESGRFSTDLLPGGPARQAAEAEVFGVGRACIVQPVAQTRVGEQIRDLGTQMRGLSLRWFEPNTWHTKPQVKAGDAELRHRLLRAKGAVHRTVGCVPWAMRGPDPAVGWLRLRSV